MDNFNFLKESQEKILEFSKNLRFNDTHIYHQSIMSLHGSIIELSGAIIVLLENNGKIGIPSIFRTLTETYVEFRNLANDKKYGYYMEANDQKQWLNLLKEAKNGNNPFLNKMSEIPDIDKEIAKIEKKLEDLKTKGYQGLSIFDKFKKAGMENVYKSVYNDISTDSHSNIRALINRHICFDSTKRNIEVVFYKDEPIQEFECYITTGTEYLINSGYIIHKILNSTKIDEIENLVNSFKKNIHDSHNK